jgi:hypothetical protein
MLTVVSKLGWSLHGSSAGLSTAQNAVHVVCRDPKHVVLVVPYDIRPPAADKEIEGIDCRKSALNSQRYN